MVTCSSCSSIFLADKCVWIISTNVMTLIMTTRSGSMCSTDHQPLANTLMTQRILSRDDNHYGMVLLALYAFWGSRAMATRQGASSGLRQDAYIFDSTTKVFSNYYNQCVFNVVGRFSWKMITQAHQMS